MTYRDQWYSAAQVLRAQAVKFEEIAKDAPPRPTDELTNDELGEMVKNLGKELTMERNWRMRLQEELWALNPSKDPRRPAVNDGSEGTWTCPTCGAIFHSETLRKNHAVIAHSDGTASDRVSPDSDQTGALIDGTEPIPDMDPDNLPSGKSFGFKVQRTDGGASDGT